MWKWTANDAMTAVQRALPVLFLVLGLPMVIFFALAVPPLQVPDEGNHLFRADQISRGELMGTRRGGEIGGAVSAPLVRLVDSVETNGKVALGVGASSASDWTARAFESFPNTVPYGPAAYLPQAAALALARWSGSSALTAFYWARILNGLMALGLATMALQIVQRGRLLFFCLLSMPMPLFLMASLSQDALLIAGSALFLALASRTLSRSRPATTWTVAGMALLLVLLGCGRPPYIVLGVFFLLKPWRNLEGGASRLRRGGLLALGVTSILLLAWIGANHGLQGGLRTDISPKGQLCFLVGHLGAIPQIAVHSLKHRGLILGMFGILGRLDLLLPLPFYPIALVSMLAAYAADVKVKDGLSGCERWLVAGALLLGGLLIHVILYLTWTPVGELAVEGVQGRYLIPLALAAVFAIPNFSKIPAPVQAGFYVVSILTAFVGAGCAIFAVLSQYA